MFASGGGGCCDCGDPEAWTDHTYCSIHKPQEMETDHVSCYDIDLGWYSNSNINQQFKQYVYPTIYMYSFEYY